MTAPIAVILLSFAICVLGALSGALSAPEKGDENK